MRRVSTSRWRTGRVVVGLLVALLALAAAALAAHPLSGHHIQPWKGHLYAGHARQAQLNHSGQEYQGSAGRGLVFRISRDGRRMRFRGHTAFSETCYRNGRIAGGFEALVVPHSSHGNGSILPAPKVTIRPNGTFSGAGSHRFKPRAGASRFLRYHFVGRFLDKGKSAVGRFLANNCSSPPFRLSAMTQTRTAVAVPSGLVAAYGFDEGSGTTVTDASGSGNNGTITNANWAASGKYGKALQFNGTGALVTIPDSASLHLSSGMTLEAWVDPSTVNANWRDVIYKGNDNFYLEATSSNASHPDAGLIAGGSYADAYASTALPANTWSYLTETYDGSTLRLYLNGTQVASIAHTGSIATSTNPLQIGGDSLYGQYFAGLIDEVRIYNRALTATQIQTDQTTSVNPTATTPDTSPPTQPGTLSANAVSGSEVDLSWGASSDNVGVTAYQIERCQGTSCTTFTQIGTSPTTTYKDTTTTANTTYTYRVRATDAAGNTSPYTNTTNATTPDTTPPSQPGTLTTKVMSGSEVNLSWGASSDNVGVTAYQIERCQGASCTTFTQIGTSPTTTYKDTTTTANTTYTYRVRATDAAGNTSPYSNTATATATTPDTSPPTQPGTLSANAVSGSEVDLSWGASSDNVGVTAYQIERCQGTSCTTFTQIGTSPTTTYKDTTTTANTTYTYRVRATDAAGNTSPYTNTTNATTPAVPSGLVAAYGFDEGSGTTVTDASGSGNNGTTRTRTGPRRASTARRCSSTARARW